MDFILHFNQVLYWLALAVWFGGLFFVAVAAPVIFRTVREADPLLPTVLSVNLEGQHGTLLAGSIVANILTALGRLQPICAGVLLVTLLVQWYFIDRNLQSILMAAIRSVLFLVAVVFMLYDRYGVWPRIMKYRQEFLDHADEPEIANPAKDEFDRYHKESVTLLMIQLFALLGMILFTGIVTYRSAVTHVPIGG